MYIDCEERAAFYREDGIVWEKARLFRKMQLSRIRILKNKIRILDRSVFVRTVKPQDAPSAQVPIYDYLNVSPIS